MRFGCHILEVFTNQGRSHVTGHNNDRILEVDNTSLIVGQPSIIQYLQKDIEYIRMSLFDFIKQDDRIRFTADRFRQLATFIIADISRRRTNQTSRTKLFLIFTHIDTSHHILVVEQIFRQRFGQLCLTDTCRTEENK